ncbi:unnamed protein product [Protopolystoma xenopodis]|uniref:Uncharacterized protein n=1 Tax=Protopolystoma xenopodis TaxID=117903 RepID=A0A448WR69_9PLAT|nr:unnamed protein product [Protopolystoma xenopodis]
MSGSLSLKPSPSYIEASSATCLGALNSSRMHKESRVPVYSDGLCPENPSTSPSEHRTNMIQVTCEQTPGDAASLSSTASIASLHHYQHFVPPQLRALRDLIVKMINHGKHEMAASLCLESIRGLQAALPSKTEFESTTTPISFGSQLDGLSGSGDVMEARQLRHESTKVSEETEPKDRKLKSQMDIAALMNILALVYR